MRATVLLVPVLLAGLACAGVDAAPVQAEPPPPPDESPDARPRDDKPRKREGKKHPGLAPVQTQGAFVPATDPCAERPSDGTFDVAFDWKGEQTHAVLYVPAGAGPHPLLVLLHAGGADPATILMQTRWDDKAKAEGFALLVPEAADFAGHGAHWNSGKFDSMVSDADLRDDVAYLDALTAKVRPEVCADRVFTAGFSSGGQMTHRWACEGEQPQALVSAAGELLVDPTGCKGPRAVRGYVGTRDKVFSGPPLVGSDQPSAPQTIERWAKINRCDPAVPPVETRVEDTTCKVWQGCAASTVLCVIDGYPHGWPSPWSRGGITRTNATDDGWRWFLEGSAGG